MVRAMMARDHATDDDARAQLERLPLRECALALSIVLGGFAAWAWLHRGGVWAWLGDGFNPVHLDDKAPGLIVLAILSFVVQIAANVAAAAARHADHLGLPDDIRRAQTLMVIGGLYNAFSLHSAIELLGVLDATYAFVAWVLSLGLAFYEPVQWWVDSSLKVAVAEATARADQRRAKRFDDTFQRPGQPSPQSQSRERGSQAPQAKRAANGVTRAAGAIPGEVARVVALHERYRHEAGWRARIAQELNISPRTVTRHLTRASAGNQIRGASAPASVVESGGGAVETFAGAGAG